ncbi:hypothetical protein D1818_17495 [Aquimarina sp. BL5]|uniref:hypothetical protein n=1 Tax=Aquimarina sp. BL5 TaxID=1714860 RepID=UPI000E5432EE|nr:hypothetical protein [Aquimarina sp. BL5]AXT52538.1 hypothetical protein D1818_17495 [Aquimarina sp. BL5]RKN11275.1 hypothetical protein D7036_01300 [Aquimarina sp. BL5]
MNANHLFEKIENSSPIDFGDIFNKSIELFKKVWLQGFIHLLISVVVVIPLIIVMYIPIIALASIAGIEESYGGYSGQMEGVSIGLAILFVILVVIISMIASAFQFGIIAHFYQVCKQEDLEQQQNSNYFMFFRGKYLGKILVLAIAISVISIVAMLLCFFPFLYVLVPLQLLGVIFSFNPDLSPSDLIKASFKLGNKIWLMAFLLFFISAILAELVGLMACGVGIFFTVFFVRIPVYYMYKDTISFENESESEDWNALVE